MKKIIFLNLILVSALSFINYSFAEDKADKATKDECISKCKEAIKLFNEKGLEETIKQINEPKGQFVWKDTYIFLLETKSGNILAHPIKPDLIGKESIKLKDANGKLFFYDIVEISKTKGEGWVDYMWQKPGEKKLCKKLTYVFADSKKEIAACAGIYE